MEFRILGPLEARRDGAAVPLGGPRPRALLTLLLLHANEPVAADRLIDELWAGRPPGTAAKVVQNGISALRKALGPERIATQGAGYAISVGADELDAARFERLSGEGQAALARGDAAGAAALLREAESLWHGPALADFEYEEFARAHAFRLEELRLAATEDRIDADLALGHDADLAAELRPLIERNPLRERLRGQLMLALYRAGRQAEALQAYRDARAVLIDELGVEPGTALQRLEKAILVQDPALELAERPATAEAPPVEEEMRKRVTALLVTFSARSAAGAPLDPEVLPPVLERARAAAAAVLRRHGAAVEEPAADSFLGLFGMPRVREDDALRAVQAAVELRHELGELASELEGAGVVLNARTGLDTAPVLTRAGVARPSLVAAGALLSARDLAARSAAGEITLGPGVEPLVRGAIQSSAVSDGAFRLEGLLRDATAIPRTLDARLVGRADELAGLRAALDRVLRERTCRLFTVLGPAGIGKSRLALEFRAETESRARVLVGRCPPYGDGTTFLPLAEVLRAAVGDDLRAGVLRLFAGDEDAQLVAERVAAITGPSGDAASAPETFWAVRKVLEKLADERPLVLVLDDLHWAEPTFLELVENVVELAAPAPILVVGLARPELLDEHPAWGGAELDASSARLEPLDGDESSALIANLLGRARMPADAQARIAAAAEGNPLFIEQMLSTLIDEGVLRRERRTWVLAGDLADRAMPATIEALLAARLDGLEGAERQILQVGSVVGPEFWLGAVAELSGQEPGEAAARLERLVRKDLVRPAPPPFPGEDAYRFRHGLIREAAYESTPKAARARLHEEFAACLERLGGEHDEALGYHLEQAHRYQRELGATTDELAPLASRAAESLWTAGRRAHERDDVTSAASLLGRAAALLPRGDPARPALLADLCETLGLLGRLAEASAVIEDAIESARALGDERLEWNARVARLRISPRLVPPPSNEEQTAEATRAIEALERIGDDRGLGRAWAVRAWVPFFEGRAAETERAARRSIEYAIRAGDRLTEGRSTRALLGAVLFGPTPVQEGLELCDAIFARVGGAHLLTAAAATRARAGLESLAGNVDLARELLARDRAIIQEVGVRMYEMNVAQVACMVELRALNPAAAEREARLGYSIARESGDRTAASEFASRLADALYRLGRTDEAWTLAEEAEHGAVEDDLQEQIHWRLPRAHLLLARGEPAEAARVAHEAVEIAARTDFLVMHAEALAVEAGILNASGRREEAKTAYDAADALFERKGVVRRVAVYAQPPR